MLLENNKESRIEVYEDSNENTVGTICVGRIRDVVPNIGAAFIETSKGNVGYFSIKDNPEPLFLNRKNTKKVCAGDLVLVQIKKEAIKTKTYQVSCRLTLTGRYVVLDCEMAGRVGISKKIKNRQDADRIRSLLLPFANDTYGFVARTDAINLTDEEILNEINMITARFHEILKTANTRTAFSILYKPPGEMEMDVMSYHLDEGDEIVTDIPEVAGLFPMSRLYNEEISLIRTYGITKKISDVLSKKVWLKTGGYLIIEPTEALTVIDINTGKYSGSIKNSESTFLKINTEACYEIARQLILRNLSGIIIVDFINMSDEENRLSICRLMKECLSKDPVKANYVDLTRLGLMEITRKKVKRPIYQILNDNKEAEDDETIHEN